MKLRNPFSELTKGEWLLYGGSMGVILLSFLLGSVMDPLVLVASLLGATALIFVAKGDPFGQIVTVVFALFYGWISFRFRYYGEMITYLGMTAPMAVFALVSWLRNPFMGNKAEVAVNRLRRYEVGLMFLLTAAVTVLFYYILHYFNTANMVPSTLSVTTSFIAVYLTFRRSPYFALAYAANDVVLILLWTLAAFENISYISVIICFIVFLVNDLYGFASWRRMEKRQSAST